MSPEYGRLWDGWLALRRDGEEAVLCYIVPRQALCVIAVLKGQKLTLNITILTPATKYQSADFRLTDPSTGRPVTNRSAKSVVLTYFMWAGFVTHTGVGRLPHNGPDLSDVVADWLADGKQRSMVDVANHLADEGTKLLNTLKRQTGQLQREVLPKVKAG